MAENQNIGALAIDLKLLTGAFGNQLAGISSQIQKHAGTWGKSLSAITQLSAGMRAGIAGAAAGVVYSLGRAMKSSIDFADQMNKMSQRTGVSVEALSGLNYAADLAGIGTESLAGGLQKLSKFMVESGEGGRDVKARFFELAEQFKSMHGGAEKTALAMKIFGKSGAELIPMLNLGRAGLEANWKEAEKFGQVIGTKFARDAEEFNDNLRRMELRLKGFANSVAAAALPLLQEGVAGGFNFKEKNPAMLLARQEAIAAGTRPEDAVRQFADSTAARSMSTAMAAIAAGESARAESMKASLAVQEKIRESTGKYVAELQKQLDVLGKSAGFLAQYEMAALGASRADQEHARALATKLDLFRQLGSPVGATMPSDTMPDAMAPPEIAGLPDFFNSLSTSALGFGNVLDKVKKPISEMEQSFRRFGFEAVEGFAQASLFGRSFGETLRNIGLEFAQLTIRALIFRAFSGFLNFGASASAIPAFAFPSIGGIAGSGFAEGGFLPPGQWGIAGERGPEPIFGGSTGLTVVPNSKGGGAGDVHIHQDNRGADFGTVQKINMANIKLYHAIATAKQADRSTRTVR